MDILQSCRIRFGTLSFQVGNLAEPSAPLATALAEVETVIAPLRAGLEAVVG